MRLLAGEINPQHGSIQINGIAPKDAADNIGISLTAPRALPLQTPSQLLSNLLSRRDVPASQRPSRVTDALEATGLFDARDRAIRELSENQRIALSIASAIAPRPPAILIDGHIDRLDDPTKHRLDQRLAERRRDEGLCVIEATNDHHRAERADRVLVMNRGEAIAFDSPSALLARYAPDTLIIETTAPEQLESAVKEFASVEFTRTATGFRIRVQDGVDFAAHLLRKACGIREIIVTPATLWELLRKRD
jgi:ABC-type multidrug transport system ATPase subunit